MTHEQQAVSANAANAANMPTPAPASDPAPLASYGTPEGFDANVVPSSDFAAIIRQGAMLTKFVKAVQTRALKMLVAGERIEGMDLFLNSQSRRLVEPDELRAKLLEHGLTELLAPVSPPNLVGGLRRAVEADRISRKEADALIDAHVHTPPESVSAGLDNDTRRPVPRDPVTGRPRIPQAKARPAAKPVADGPGGDHAS